MRLRLLTAALLLMVGIGAVGYVILEPSATANSTSQYLTAQATVTNVVQQAVATGSVAASTTYGLGFGRQPDVVTGTSSSTSSSSSSGSTTWVVSAVNVTVGEPVTAGEVLATADGSSAQLALQVAQANLAAAQDKLATDKASPNAAQKAAARIALQQAQNSLTSSEQSAADAARQAALTVQSARTAVTTAENQLATDTTAKAPAATLTADRKAITQARQSLAQAEAQAASSNQQSSSGVTNARLSLKSAQNTYKTALLPATAATIASDEAAVASAQEAVNTAQTTLGGDQITAPAAGTVVSVSLVNGLPAPAGDAIDIETGQMNVTADFPESSMPSLKVGQAASVSITALGQTVAGTVSQITPVAATSGTSTVVTFAVTVTLGSSPAALRSGMSATVAITTASATGVVAVPSIALLGSAGNYDVRVIDSSGNVSVVPVQVGLVTSSLAEIQSGLKAGDTVITGSSTARTGTTTSTGGGFGGLGGLGGGGVRFSGGGAGSAAGR